MQYIQILNPAFGGGCWHRLTEDVLSPETHEVMFKRGELVTHYMVMKMLAVGVSHIAMEEVENV